MSAERPSHGTDPAQLAKFRKINLLASLSDEALRATVSRATVKRYPKGVEIVSFNDETSDVFFVVEGRIQIRNFSQGGRELIYSEIESGNVFGEFSAVDGLPRSASVVTIEESTVARLKSSDFLELLRANFDLNLKLLRLLTAKARGLTDRVLELVALSARDRLRFELSRLSAKGTREGPSVILRPAPTHYALAAKVGSHREAITRELNRLVALGYLRLSRQEIVILDIDRFNEDLLSDGGAA